MNPKYKWPLLAAGYLLQIAGFITFFASYFNHHQTGVVIAGILVIGSGILTLLGFGAVFSATEKQAGGAPGMAPYHKYGIAYHRQLSTVLLGLCLILMNYQIVIAMAFFGLIVVNTIVAGRVRLSLRKSTAQEKG